MLYSFPLFKMSVKLYLYKAAKANVVVLLRRSGKRDQWEMIRWDLDTDTFVEGQWLLKKVLDPKSASLSPCGRFFAYSYSIYGFVKGEQNFESHGVVSEVPNFTALYFNGNFGGGYGLLGFTESGEVIASSYIGGTLVKKGDVALRFFPLTPDTLSKPLPLAPTGRVPDVWTDPKGRLITTKDGKLFADGTLLYDTTDHVFAPKTA